MPSMEPPDVTSFAGTRSLAGLRLPVARAGATVRVVAAVGAGRAAGWDRRRRAPSRRRRRCRLRGGSRFVPLRRGRRRLGRGRCLVLLRLLLALVVLARVVPRPRELVAPAPALERRRARIRELLDRLAL